METKGLVMVHTGYGKGKTTAALGLAFRCLGHGLPVCIIQFIKGTWKYGELASAKRFNDLLDLHVMGNGFTWKSNDPERDRKGARLGWELAKARIEEGRHHLIILDELTYAMNFRMLEVQEILDSLKGKPPALNILITGRDAPKSIMEAADMVTEMRELKHHFKAGIQAQKGIEF